MKKLRIYVDTSVFGGCFDREYQESSRAFFQLAAEGGVILLISNITSKELSAAPGSVKEVFYSLPPESIESVMTSVETEKLRDRYLDSKILGVKQFTDAHHIATATVYDSDVIVSWNFKHLVRLDKIRKFNAVNLEEGYPLIDIRSPREVLR
jgi:predicted nucleic acid-binding protein